MKIRYFTDTDTALIEFSDAPVVETREISENLYADLDESGNVVSVTVEHARKATNMSEISYVQVDSTSPSHLGQGRD